MLIVAIIGHDNFPSLGKAVAVQSMEEAYTEGVKLARLLKDDSPEDLIIEELHDENSYMGHDPHGHSFMIDIGELESASDSDTTHTSHDNSSDDSVDAGAGGDDEDED